MLHARTHQTNAFIFSILYPPPHLTRRIHSWLLLLHVCPAFFYATNICNCLCVCVGICVQTHNSLTHTCMMYLYSYIPIYIYKWVGCTSEPDATCDFTNQILNLCKCKLRSAINIIFSESHKPLFIR